MFFFCCLVYACVCVCVCVCVCARVRARARVCVCVCVSTGVSVEYVGVCVTVKRLVDDVRCLYQPLSLEIRCSDCTVVL